MKTFALNKDGSLEVLTDDAVLGKARWNIQASQIAAHRRDPEFEAALQASTLTAAEKLSLPAPGAKVAP